jgi:hypothetical protein
VPRRSALAGAAHAALVAPALLVLLASCCPAAGTSAPELAALRVRLEPAPGGGLTAVLPQGGRVALAGGVAAAAPLGTAVYLRGTWLPDGRLSVTSVDPLPGAR